MGLDITAYRALVPATADLDEDGYPVEYEKYWKPGTSAAVSERAFPGRGQGLDFQSVYSFTDSFGFRAGSYGGYNRWRNLLARMAGYGSAERAWEAADEPGPFIELINFSDCEGVIGPAVSAKLARDFGGHENLAREFAAGLNGYDSQLFIELYVNWKRAFEMAADGGAIHFH